MERLPPGQEIKGPAIFESATTTVVIRADERALVTREGWLDVTIA
jgi:N-methylhydantoinase A